MSAPEEAERTGEEGEEGTRVDDKGREIRREMVYGMVVDVVMCRPSRRRAASSVQKDTRRGSKRRGKHGMWAARDRGLKTGE